MRFAVHFWKTLVNTKRLVILAIGSLLLFSCESCEGEEGVQVRKFWALDNSKARPEAYLLKATLKAEGEHCKIWVEEGRSVAQSVLLNLVSEYDNKIRPALLKNFSVQGPVTDPATGKVVGQNTLDWADYLTDGDGKLTILILKMPSDPKDEEVYVAGYFWTLNFYAKNDSRNPDARFSNESDMLYINIDMEPGSPEFNNTLAHELQHLMNFANSALLRRYQDTGALWDWNQMDVWITEGLSAAAEYVYSGEYNMERLAWFTDHNGIPSQKGSKISEGNTFFVWGERPGNGAMLDEYATVYLFFQWLRLQSGGTEIYQDISTAKLFDYEAVVNALRGKGNYSDASKLEWNTLLRDWFAANALNTDEFEKYPLGTLGVDPKHGYMKDPLLSIVRASSYPQNTSSFVNLYPGEGVYSCTSASKRYANEKNIRYAGVSRAPLTDELSHERGILITYNTNTVNSVQGNYAKQEEYRSALKTLQERAQISGESCPSRASASASVYAGSMRSIGSSAFDTRARSFKPQAISIWDMLWLNEQKVAVEKE